MHPARIVPAAVVVLVVVLVVGLVGVPTADADAAPRLSLAPTGYPTPTLPFELDPDEGDYYHDQRVDLVVRASASVSDVTYSIATDGVVVDQPTGALGTVAPGSPVPLSFVAGGVRPGLHDLAVTVSAAGVDPVTVDYPFVWSPGNQAVTARDTLAGRSYELTTVGPGDDCESCDERVSYFVTFLANGRAHVGPTSTVPACAHTNDTCLPYRYDAATGLVQVGARIFGRLDSSRSFLINASNQAGGVDDDDAWATFQRVAPLASRHVGGSWRYSAPTAGLGSVALTLHRDGRYDLRYALTGRYEKTRRRHLHGRYRLGSDGMLTLRYPAGPHTERMLQKRVLLLGATTPAGQALTPRPVWLALTYGTGRDARTDGDLLQPARR